MSIKIGNIDVSYFKVGGADCSIYIGDVKMYPTTPPTPTGSTCYEVINGPITAYTATTYDSVYSFADSKWYMKNNLNQYEEYGIYDTANTLSDLTYYDGKLAVVGTTEYQYSGGTWVSAGTYVTTEVTYDIPSGYSTTYQGQIIPTTFKISVADMNVLGTRYISIYDNTKTSYYLQASKTRYMYYGSPKITGTVTSDSDYYYFTLTDAKPSIEIYRTRGFNGTVHIIAEQPAPSVLYQEKDVPLAKVYQSVAAMEAEVCPSIGLGQYGVVGSDVYQFDSTEEWVTIGNHYKVLEKSNNVANIVWSDSSSSLTSDDTKPRYFDYSDITEVIIGNDITSIGDRAFLGCNSLISITIPSGVTSIGDRAFNSCSSLTSIDIPNRVTTISASLFGGCSSLTSVTIPNSVTSIGNFAFNGCRSLTSIGSVGSGASIEIPSNITSISGYVFDGCSGLTSATIPNNVTNIGEGIFRNCVSLSSITVDGNNTKYDSRDNCNAIIETSTNKLIQGCKNTIIPNSVTSIGDSAFGGCSITNIIMPNSIRSIGNGAFYQCSGLTGVTIPDSVTSIGGNAFSFCKALTSITIPNSVTSIGDRAFQDCDSLTSCTLGDSLTSIGNYVFQNCSSLTSITIPSSVTSIGDGTFQNCSGLTSVTCLATTPPSLGSSAFNNTNDCPIYVPSSSVETYKTATNWSTYASRIQAIQ